MLHRAASTCAVATMKNRQPHLVYLHFCPSPLRNCATTHQYISDLRELRQLLGEPQNFAFSVAEIEMTYTPAFEAIKDLNKRDRVTAAIVSKALCDGRLFNFGTPMITRM